MNEAKKQQFLEILNKTLPKKNTTHMDIEKYNAIVKKNKDARKGLDFPNKHWLLKHYDILNVSGKDQLISPIVNNKILYYVPMEQIFDILDQGCPNFLIRGQH